MYQEKKKIGGITLIALVITVIIMLILAGVTVSALNGENGIIKKATQAKSKIGRSNALEQINLAIITARTEGLGQVDKTVLRDEITKAGMTVKTDGDDLPWEVVSDKYLFRINENYTVEEVKGISLSKKEIRLEPGQSETLTVILGDDATGKIIWESSDNNVATVENGKVTATGQNGEATITAKANGTNYEDTCKVIVTTQVTEITKIVAEDLTLEPGKTGKLSVTIEPTNQTEGLIYTSGTESVATVEQDGTVNALKEGTSIITIKGKISGVLTECTVTVKSSTEFITASEIMAEPEKYYGEEVLNYNKENLTYRIFYVDTEGKYGDKNTVYLKADLLPKWVSMQLYVPSGADLEIYKKLNPMWAKNRGSDTSIWNYNEKGAAWLASPSKWTLYCDETKANYAVGGPSIEMYVDSYNKVPHIQSGNNKLETKYSSTNTPGYSYIVNGIEIDNMGQTDEDTLDYVGYNGMYSSKNYKEKWWIASPESGDRGWVCSVENTILGKYVYAYDFGAHPIISLKKDFKLQVKKK